MKRQGTYALAVAVAWAMLGLTLAPAARAAEPNATGTWKSSFTRQNGEKAEITYKLKQDGDKLTGTIKGPGGDETEIKDGQAKDGDLSFTLVRERNGQTFTMKYKGKQSGDMITGKVSFEFNGETRDRDWTATRDAG